MMTSNGLATMRVKMAPRYFFVYTFLNITYNYYRLQQQNATTTGAAAITKT
jgi:hypothetical protein